MEVIRYSILAAFFMAVATVSFLAGKPLLLLSWPGSDPSLSSILLNSHIDSIPAEPSKWFHSPFVAVRDIADRIFARDAQDDKCLAIQYLETLRNLKDDAPSFFCRQCFQKVSPRTLYARANRAWRPPPMHRSQSKAGVSFATVCGLLASSVTD